MKFNTQNPHLPIYHTSTQAVYRRASNGVLSVFSKRKGTYAPRAIAMLSNDEDGLETLKVIKYLHPGRYRVVYRCPKGGQTYDQINGPGNARCAQIPKAQALVIVVLWK